MALERETQAKTFADLAVGEAIEREIVWSEADRETFAKLTGDNAPVHRDAKFARSLGFENPILFGMLVAAGLSPILGCELPGAFSVIHSVRVDFAGPAFPGERLKYRAEIKNLSPATKTAMLDVRVTRAADNGVVLRGQVQCGLKR